MSLLVRFLMKLNAKIAQHVNEMEKLIFIDPRGSLVKARLFLEEIVDSILKIESLNHLKYESLFDKINYLSEDENYLTRNIQGSFNTIRQKGNLGAHRGESNFIEHAFNVHKEIYNIAIWFSEVYEIGRAS